MTGRLLLDTHVFLWAVRAPEKLSTRVVALLEDRSNELLVCSGTPWELAIKYRSGKLPEAGPVITDYAATLLRLGASSLPISHSHSIQAGLLDWDHRDPFDRLLAGVAVIEGLPLVSRDEVFDSLPEVSRVW
ncbi:MAG: type II toxin-antitoxin system VapC family toxin [Propionibacteriaceae bacterium]|jgi:PIN domain nuclease of toxin-antitoxin system|nr:type II toxin-antitoxin system VapC family toxin [Propionibacteriaceae bacterium]